MSIFFNYNAGIYKQGKAVITPDNCCLKYGDGLFETMKMIKGEIILKEYHFERLFAGMDILQFDKPQYFTPSWLQESIKHLANKNLHAERGRIRLMVFRGEGNLYDVNNSPNFIIQTWDLSLQKKLNNGLAIDIFSDAKKSCDKFSNLKSNNFLAYAMAAKYAQNKKLDDCILLNQFGSICDSSTANVFIIKDNSIYTPPLSEGCVAGVIRRWMLTHFHLQPFQIFEKPITIENLQMADEIFLTNAIKGVIWVKQFRKKEYKNNSIKKISKFLNKLLLEAV